MRRSTVLSPSPSVRVPWLYFWPLQINLNHKRHIELDFFALSVSKGKTPNPQILDKAINAC